MEREIKVKSQSGRIINYILKAEKGKFELYVSFKKIYKVDGGASFLDKGCFNFVKNPDLNKELGIKNNDPVFLPNFDKSEYIKEIQKEIVSSNQIIKVSYLKNHADYVVEYDLEFNLTNKESEKYKTSDNDFRITYEIPAQELYVEREKKESKNYKIICPKCEEKYWSDESILFHNGCCPKCGF